VKIACVVHRYGAEIAGGSEAHCRHIAEHLAARHDVTVLTSCAKDHVTWRNEYPAGETAVNGVRVRRFAVARQRSLHRFAAITAATSDRRHTEEQEREWFRENGPDMPELLAHLAAAGANYDRVLFWAFRYANAFFGLPLVADRAILVPTAEEDPVVKFEVLEQYLQLPRGFLFLTPEEQMLVARRASTLRVPSCVIGSGFEPATARAAMPLEGGVREPFMLYLGRVDPNKGCEVLIRHFTRYAAERPDASLQLVLAGPANMPIPAHPAIRPLGFVSEQIREALLARAALLVVPSRYESLSLALLEGWNHGVPALVNGRCAVLEGQVRRAGGGLYFRDYDEFACATDYLLGQPDIARELGRQGLAYVDREYRWPTVMQKVEQLLAQTGALTSPGDYKPAHASPHS
jgi:glycosyltransferase involved in cell wall biosynthesis